MCRWKTRLPQHWADSGVSRRILPGVMDPAMTAANATHNTCLILLHERIAYSDAKLNWVQLPSLFSADTCYSAAVEVCTIIRKTLSQRGAKYPGTPQLGLCAFVSARTLLCECSVFSFHAVRNVLANTLAQYTGGLTGSHSHPSSGSLHIISTTWRKAGERTTTNRYQFSAA